VRYGATVSATLFLHATPSETVELVRRKVVHSQKTQAESSHAPKGSTDCSPSRRSSTTATATATVAAKGASCVDDDRLDGDITEKHRLFAEALFHKRIVEYCVRHGRSHHLLQRPTFSVVAVTVVVNANRVEHHETPCTHSLNAHITRIHVSTNIIHSVGEGCNEAVFERVIRLILLQREAFDLDLDRDGKFVARRGWWW